VAYTAATGTFTVTPWTVPPIAADAYKVFSNTVTAVEEVDVGSTTTSIVVVGASFTPNQHAGSYVTIYPASGAPLTRRIVSNTLTTLTITPSLPAAPVANTSYLEILANSIVLTSRDYGAHTNSITADVATSSTGAKILTLSFEGKDEISPGIGNFPFLKLLFKGAAVTTTDSAIGTLNSTTLINLTNGGLVPGAEVGKQVEVDGEFTVITANTATAITVSPALSVPPLAGDAVLIHNIKTATATVAGSAGVATSLVTSTGIVGADLNIVFPAGMTLRQLVSTINLNTNYLAEVPSNINPDTSFAAAFDFGVTVPILVSPFITTEGLKQDTDQMVNYVNQVSTLAIAARATDSVHAGASTVGDIGEPIPMTGGTRGTSTNSSFQAGFDAMLTVRVNHVVPLIDSDLINEGFGSTATIASVAAQLKDHVIACRGEVGSERGGYIGVDGTKATILAQAAALNDMDVAVCPQRVTLLDLSGNLVEFGPRMQAVLAAGSRSGVFEIGEPLTHKTVKTSALSNDDSWSAGDLTDANDMIQGGILFAQTDDTNVTRWCRDLTTYISDNNLAYSEGSIRSVTRYVAYNLRKVLVDRYVGRKAAPKTIRNVQNTAIVFLEQCRQDSIIVDSTDPVTGVTTKAYHSMVVSSDGDVVKLCVGIFPVIGINFILNDISLGIASQLA
jgi:hypothetical protein